MKFGEVAHSITQKFKKSEYSKDLSKRYRSILKSMRIPQGTMWWSQCNIFKICKTLFMVKMSDVTAQMCSARKPNIRKPSKYWKTSLQNSSILRSTGPSWSPWKRKLEKGYCTAYNLLNKLWRTVSILKPQRSKSRKSEEAKVGCLCSAMVVIDCGDINLTNCYTQKPIWEVQQYYTALTALYVQEYRLNRKLKTFQSSIPWRSQDRYDCRCRFQGKRYPKGGNHKKYWVKAKTFDAISIASNNTIYSNLQEKKTF